MVRFSTIEAFMTRRQLFLSGLPLALGGRVFSAGRLPNIVYIYADDLGWGDVSCYGATRVATPNIDRIAKGGVRFTHAHSSSATCTPSRYSLMTGEYAWRRRGTGVLPGNASLIVEPGRYTLPAMLRKAGYATGAVGKWHLGLGAADVDWNGEIKPGPLEVGFDYSYIFPATGDRVPCVYIENHRVVNLDPSDPITVAYDKPIPGEPTGKSNPELLRLKPSFGHDQAIVNGVSRIGYMKGGKSARWVDEDMADVLTSQAVRFMERQQANPFFLYFATHDIHVPRVPNRRFVGKTPMGPRGDAIVELDWSVGQVLDALDRLRIADRTLVIFTSDNGPVLDDGYQDHAVELLGDHKPAGPYRGGKYSAYDGGTCVPFLVRYPGHTKPGVSDALVSQVDMLGSLAAFVKQSVPVDAAPDSLNVLPALLGQSRRGRADLVEHASALAIIAGEWKAIEPHAGAKRDAGNETGNDASLQLFHLSEDPGEKNNLAERYPERVRAMLGRLEEIRNAGKSR
jgi:arylsulfatase A-like enzyme